MTDLLRAAIASLSSHRARELLTGVGQGFDPVPKLYHDTFCKSDLTATAADWEAIYLDWWRAYCQLVEHARTKHTRTLTEVQHRQRTTSRAAEQRERELA
jgi:hypothetical protein